MLKQLNKELFVENTVGIASAALVIIAIIASSFWISDKSINHSPPSQSKQKIQELKATSISEAEINKLYEKKQAVKAAQIAAEKAERKKLADEKAQLEAAKKQLAEEKRKAIEAKKAKVEAAKKAKAEAAKKAEAEVAQKANTEAAKKAKAKADAAKKAKAEAAQKAKAEAAQKAKAEAAQKAAQEKIKNDLAASLAADIAEREAEERAQAAQQQAITDAKEKNAAIIRYSRAIKDKIQTRWQTPPKLPSGLKVKLGIKLSSNGKVIGNPRVIKSSGYRAFDLSAIEAVKRASPLPLPNKKEWVDEFTKDEVRLNFP